MVPMPGRRVRTTSNVSVSAWLPCLASTCTTSSAPARAWLSRSDAVRQNEIPRSARIATATPVTPREGTNGSMNAAIGTPRAIAMPIFSDT
jgi:hypothetical protein